MQRVEIKNVANKNFGESKASKSAGDRFDAPKKIMNSTENSLKRIYSYLASTSGALAPAPVKRAARYSPLVESPEGSASDWNMEILVVGAILENDESRQYQKCLSRLTVEILPPALNQSALIPSYSRTVLN